MARYAVISNNVITNLVDWDGGPEWSPPPGTTAELAPMPCGVGWTWNDGNPVDPNPPPPPPPDPREAERGLMRRRIGELEASGTLEDQVAALKLRLQLLGG
jgi:hypothetical protein